MKQLLTLFAFATGLAAQPKCAIRGTVVDALTSQRLARAQVFVNLESVSDDDSAPPVRRVTDMNGAFCFDTLATGSYSVRATRAFYVDATNGEHWPGDVGESVNVSPGKPTPPLTIGLMPEATISGVLTDAEGDPIRGARIELLKRQWKAGRLTTRTIVQAETDDIGRYRFARLAAGTYFISATPAVASSKALSPVFLDGGRRPFRELEGKTYYKDSISFGHAAPIHLKAGQEISRLTLTLRSTQTRHVSGRVLPAALNNTSPRILWCAEKGSSDPFTRLNIAIQEDGRFLAEGLSPTRYQIWGPGAASTEIDLSEADIDNLIIGSNERIALQIDVHIEGANSAVPIRTLKLVQKDDSGQSQGFIPSELISPNKFHALVRPGHYEIELSGNGRDYFNRSLIVNGEPQRRSVFNLQAGTPAVVELFLTTNVITIQGSVVDDQGLPVEATLLVEDEFHPGQPHINLIGHGGEFHINLLHAGSYRLYAFASLPGNEWGNPELASLLADKSVALEVQEGQYRRVSLSLISADHVQAALSKTEF